MKDEVESEKLIKENHERLIAIEECMEEISLAIYGSEKINALGLMKRVSTIEDAIKRWQNLETMMKGALLLMMLTSGVNIYTILEKIGVLP